MVARLLRCVEATVGWLFAYPLIPLQVLLFWLIAWGRLGYGLGLDDLFWSERNWEQAANGLACGLLFGLLFTVRYLLDRGRDRFRLPGPLLPIRDPDVDRLGRYLTWFWLPALAVLGGVKLLSPDVWAGCVRVWPMLGGLVLSVLLVVLIALIADRTGLVAAVARLPLPGEGGKPLHAVAFLSAAAFALALVGACAAYAAGAVLPPVVVLCLVLGVVNAVHGFLAFRWPGSQFVVLAALIAWALWANSSLFDRNRAYHLTIPGLENEYADPRPLFETRKDEQGRRTDHYYELLKAQAAGQSPAPDLIPSEDPVRAMAARWQAGHPGGQTKPRLVLICTSGGGIRAAVWTAVVLEGLEREMPEPFRDHIRLITGASGGMQGAALYAADFEAGRRTALPDPTTGLGPLSGPLAEDSLRPTVQTMLLTDLPALWRPTAPRWDRGRAIEKAWADNTSAGGQSPFRKPFAELRDLEREGRRPSLVFSPVLVEDARRLLISNLDLLDLTWTSGDVVGFGSFRRKFGVPNGPDESLLSLSAVELFRLFPRSQAGFQVGTAARLNAAFPLVSPGVSLPTDPPRRVVDAGYYDNYGVNLAALWLYRHERAIREHTSGVVLIEIRAYRNGYARWHFQDQEAEKDTGRGPAPACGSAAEPADDDHPRPDPQEGGRPRRDRGALVAALEWASTPVETLLEVRARSPYYRNDELLDGLDKHFNRPGRRLFTTVAFECEVDAALSWTLPKAEARLIAEAFAGPPPAGQPIGPLRPHIASRVSALKRWFGDGGGPPIGAAKP